MIASQRLFLGVDGGQSSSRAVVGDASGQVLGRAAGAPCNRAATATGRERLTRVTGDLVRTALAAAGLPEGAAFEAACFGMSGGPDDKRDVLAGLVPGARVEVTNDAEVALEGACSGQAGAVVIAGTGSIALARDKFGTVIRRGGWGYVFGDDGSAFDIVRNALRGALAAEEGWGDPTELRGVFLEATGCRSLNDALHRFYDPDWPRYRIASLAPSVDATARGGDELARVLLRNAGTALATLAERVAEPLYQTNRESTVYAVGGVFRSSWVKDSFAMGVRTRELTPAQPAHDAAVGALLRAYRSVGLEVPVQEAG